MFMHETIRIMNTSLVPQSERRGSGTPKKDTISSTSRPTECSAL